MNNLWDETVEIPRTGNPDHSYVHFHTNGHGVYASVTVVDITGEITSILLFPEQITELARKLPDVMSRALMANNSINPDECEICGNLRTNHEEWCEYTD